MLGAPTDGNDSTCHPAEWVRCSDTSPGRKKENHIAVLDGEPLGDDVLVGIAIRELGLQAGHFRAHSEPRATAARRSCRTSGASSTSKTATMSPRAMVRPKLSALGLVRGSATGTTISLNCLPDRCVPEPAASPDRLLQPVTGLRGGHRIVEMADVLDQLHNDRCFLIRRNEDCVEGRWPIGNAQGFFIGHHLDRISSSRTAGRGRPGRRPPGDRPW